VSPALAAVLALVVVLLVLPARARGAPPPARRRPAGDDARPETARQTRQTRRAALAAIVAGAGIAVLVGGVPGAVLGGVGAALVGIVVPRLDRREERQQREALVTAAPLLVDLVAACLASGAALDAALEVSARAVDPPASTLVLDAVRRTRLGADPAHAWAALREDPALGGLARAVLRSGESGAALADLLPRAAAEARARHRVHVEARIRTASVRLTAPLALAFLPAFVLLGVVPVVASWAGALF
jgi:pilus assembly protein TadC